MNSVIAHFKVEMSGLRRHLTFPCFIGKADDSFRGLG